MVTLANKIKCSHILVEKQSQAIAILDRIKQGEKFGKLAKELSIDSGSAKRDGSLGYFGRGTIRRTSSGTYKKSTAKRKPSTRSGRGYVRR